MTDDTEAVRQVALDYFEGWFEGDVERMDRALHPELVKRRGDAAGLPRTTKTRMLELTGQGEGSSDRGDGRLEVEVLDVHGSIATVMVRGGVYHEYLHLVRAGDVWQIADALWAYE